MNPITMIMILSICCVISAGSSLILAIIAYKRKKELNECSLELADYDNKNVDLKTALLENQNQVYEKTLEINALKDKNTKQEQSLEQYDFKFNEQIRLNNESEQALKDIISEHDKEMREQRERFEKFNATLYTKAEVIDFVKETYKNIKGNSNGVVEYIKEFKANL